MLPSVGITVLGFVVVDCGPVVVGSPVTKKQHIKMRIEIYHVYNITKSLIEHHKKINLRGERHQEFTEL